MKESQLLEFLYVTIAEKMSTYQYLVGELFLPPELQDVSIELEVEHVYHEGSDYWKFFDVSKISHNYFCGNVDVYRIAEEACKLVSKHGEKVYTESLCIDFEILKALLGFHRQVFVEYYEHSTTVRAHRLTIVDLRSMILERFPKVYIPADIAHKDIDGFVFQILLSQLFLCDIMYLSQYSDLMRTVTGEFDFWTYFKTHHISRNLIPD